MQCRFDFQSRLQPSKLAYSNGKRTGFIERKNTAKFILILLHLLMLTWLVLKQNKNKTRTKLVAEYVSCFGVFEAKIYKKKFSTSPVPLEACNLGLDSRGNCANNTKSIINGKHKLN